MGPAGGSDPARARTRGRRVSGLAASRATLQLLQGTGQRALAAARCCERSRSTRGLSGTRTPILFSWGRFLASASMRNVERMHPTTFCSCPVTFRGNYNSMPGEDIGARGRSRAAWHLVASGVAAAVTAGSASACFFERRLLRFSSFFLRHPSATRAPVTSRQEQPKRQTQTERRQQGTRTCLRLLLLLGAFSPPAAAAAAAAGTPSSLPGCTAGGYVRER